MSKQTFARLQEMRYTHTLPNGLQIVYIPKEGYEKTFAVLATNFGSIDECFTIEGQSYAMPTGVAHFLEHKMFEDVDGNALQKFATTGASPNAFTSHTMTAYHFSCTNCFTENLKILLQFVYTPYFTDENVEKEKGIIGQEIGMMDDTPSWQAMLGVFAGMYREHPVRRSIAGSVESIAQITKETLYTCHQAFYSPSNMVLVVVGNADFDQICQLASVYSPQESVQIGTRSYGEHVPSVYQAQVEQKMDVSKPIFMLGLKDTPVSAQEGYLKRSIIGGIATQLLCGKSTQLYTSLYQNNLIEDGFAIEYEIFPAAACVIAVGESQNPQAVQEAITNRLQELAQVGISEEEFQRACHARYGAMVRMLDDLEDIARMEVTEVFQGEIFLDFPSVFASIGVQDIMQILKRWANTPDNQTLSIVYPTEGEV